jgi:hypothetical protein
MSQNTKGVLLLGALVGAMELPACSGGNPAIADRLVENRGAEAFLDRIAKNCGKLSVGNQQLDYLLDQDSDDTYFVDETSKLYFGRVDKAAYSSDINSFYPTDTNGSALDCIFAQLGD